MTSCAFNVCLILLYVSLLLVLVCCKSLVLPSENANPPMITVPSGEKFVGLSNIRRSANPLALEGGFAPNEPTLLTEKTRTTRFLYLLGFSCVIVMSSIQRLAVIRNLDVTF